VASDEQSIEPAAAEPTGNPLRKVALIIVLVATFLFVLSIFMERRTPSSSQAQVQAYVVGIASEVAGRVVEVNVTDNSRVEPDQVLFRIDPSRYQIAVAEAEAALAQVGQTIGASTATVDSVQAQLVEARTNRDNLGDIAARADTLWKRGVYAKAQYDEAKSEFDQAEASVKAAEAELVRAQLDLLRTTVRAPSAGVVTNLQLSIGKVVSVGQAAMTFIDIGTVWIAAAFKENSLENVAVNNSAEVLFDALPGQLFSAKVESVGLGVSQSNTDPNTGLPTIREDSGWIREPQLFPVRLILDDPRPKGVRYGSQATVVIYTGDNPVTNAWGYFWIRVLSVLTYAG